MQNFVIKGAIVYDGCIAAPTRTDILVQNGVIAQIGLGVGGAGIAVINAEGYVIAPGFIDIHRHCDIAFMRDSDFGQLELAQGITTAIVGNCGLSPVPLNHKKNKEFHKYIEPVVGKMTDNLHCNSYESYTKALKNSDIAINLGYLAGIGSVRYAVKKFLPQLFSATEMDKAVQLVEAAMQNGAFGASLGIMYRPECYTMHSEYIKLLRPVSRHEGVLCTHIRGEGDSLVSSIQEVIDIAQKAEVRVNISHLKATGIANWHDKIFKAIECIENARNNGVQVTADFYPYDGGATTIMSLLPPTMISIACEDFAKSEIIERLQQELNKKHNGWDNMVASIGWERILIGSVNNDINKLYQGQSFAQAAQQIGCDNPAKLLAQLIVSENGSAGIIVLSMAWEDIQAVARLPYTVLISDSLYAGGDAPHPRLYGAFPRMVKKLVTEEKIITLEQAINKMTLLPAQIMGIKKRGTIKVGYNADITIFKPEQLADTATYTMPKSCAVGMKMVIVNGTIALLNEKATAQRSGKLLLSPPPLALTI